MPAKNDRVQKIFFLTPAQDEYLRQNVVKGELSDYIRSLIKADKPAFPDDMPPRSDIREYNEQRKKK